MAGESREQDILLVIEQMRNFEQRLMAIFIRNDDGLSTAMFAIFSRDKSGNICKSFKRRNNIRSSLIYQKFYKNINGDKRRGITEGKEKEKNKEVFQPNSY